MLDLNITVGSSILALRGFDPAPLFAAGEQGLWLDPSDLSTMFQDAAGTTPAVVGQPVGLVLDKSGRGNHASQATTAQKPILQQDGSGNYYLAFDGVDDSLSTAAIDFTGTDEVTTIAAVRKNSDAADGVVVELSPLPNTNNGSYFLHAPSGATSNFYFATKGTAFAGTTAQPFAAPVTAVVTGYSKISQPIAGIRANGVQKMASTASQGTGNYGNYPLYIGRRGGTTLPFNGRIYSLIVRGKLTEGDDLTSVEEYVAGKTGVTL